MSTAQITDEGRFAVVSNLKIGMPAFALATWAAGFPGAEQLMGPCCETSGDPLDPSGEDARTLFASDPHVGAKTRGVADGWRVAADASVVHPCGVRIVALVGGFFRVLDGDSIVAEKVRVSP